MMIVMMMSLLMMIVMMMIVMMMLSRMRTTLPSPGSRSPTRRRTGAPFEPREPREPVFVSPPYFFNCSSCRLAFWLFGSSSMAFSKLLIAFAVSVFFA